ncbi:hypothetical protein DFH07DRAFT_968041 [Mycena maculata]|uniref:C2 domain-containing protein n=1 Tax=Mycena maculata TaxID=230809 RepID=A0AAD7I3P5_9AGAR|nr:hypothetical protein DFH07DRAFT_968041 [Mycena maculata]
MDKHHQELGTLVIVVLKAKDLHDKHFWKQDVFAQVGLNGETKRTKVDIKGGQTPMWDEEIRIPVMKNSAEKYRKLEVSCWDTEPKKEENIGQGFVDLTETLKTGEFDDWVKLQVNDIARGEIYLEMTFFANAPAPAAAGLSVPQSNLARRPSKLSPAERLARAPYTAPGAGGPGPHRQQVHPQQQGHPQHEQPANGHLSTSPPTRTSPSRAGRESPLPPLPEQQPPVPDTLTPGRLKPHGGAPQHVPSILRPRNPKSSPTPLPRPAVEYNGVVPPQGPSDGYAAGSSPPRTYTPVVPPPETTGYVQPPQSHWGSNDSPADFSFPVPDLPGAREPTVEYSTPPYNPPPQASYPGPGPHDRYGSGGSTSPFNPPPFQQQPGSFQQPPGSFPQPPGSFQPHHPSFSAGPPSFQQQPPSFQAPPTPYQSPPPAARNNGDLPDPYLLARYQSPLPLPSEDDSPPRGRHGSQSHAAPPQSQPAPQSQPTAASQSNPDNARLQALKQVEDEAARKRAQEERDREARIQALKQEEKDREARIQALRREEEEVARKKAQEERDREARIQALRREEEEAARKKAQEERDREARVRALKQVEAEAARRKAQEETDRELARLQAANQVKDEATRRREQEERDRELARQLDRELNLGEAAAGGDMPGRW